MWGFALVTRPGVKGLRCLLPQLLLPGVNLRGMNFIALGRVRHALLLSQCVQGDLRPQPRVNIPSRLLRLCPLRLPTEQPVFQSFSGPN